MLEDKDYDIDLSPLQVEEKLSSSEDLSPVLKHNTFN